MGFFFVLIELARSLYFKWMIEVRDDLHRSVEKRERETGRTQGVRESCESCTAGCVYCMYTVVSGKTTTATTTTDQQHPLC